MKKMFILITISIMMIVLLIVLTGCGKNNENNNTQNNSTTESSSFYKSNDEKTSNTSTNNNEKASNVSANNNEKTSDVNYEENAKKQLEKPKVGDTVAIIHVKKFGDIKVKFFPEVAPKAVENFTTHAKNGYYNGLTFHRVIEDFMIQGGDPKGNGTGGESIWGEGFGTELDESLVPYKGALCMAMSNRPNSIGSQFFIVQADYDSNMSSYLKSSGYPQDLLDQYKNYGGYLSLYLQYTVFGQVYEGIEVVDAITKVEKNMSSTGEMSVPVEDVVIDSIEVTTYNGK